MLACSGDFDTGTADRHHESGVKVEVNENNKGQVWHEITRKRTCRPLNGSPGGPHPHIADSFASETVTTRQRVRTLSESLSGLSDGLGQQTPRAFRRQDRA
ncbi:hypothetical protein F442_18118 [Phytophthora nicotianae P10297]|uniref:Uncharacterized protein n=2 Tax=Phytophthora nicotianae TaxID=4792 RepID=W2PNM7_PHYN3|nr:hypothetical protein PPTG_24014 [Phytophthora nicotianae INRA-310]ETN01844.1 hypothetical protein PPTG_24014 [Phytophthora nicotianae INRA-310]ETP33349.1 hypothetical protein F442_18118 [Phytophthora nicotianae P10297]